MKNVNTLKATTLALALGFATSSISAMAFNTDEVQAGQAPLSAEFTKLDTNGNNLLGRKARKDKLFTKKNFAEADVDQDGTLDQDEYASYKSAAQQKVVDRVVDDSVITTKAKAGILATKDLKSVQISVETRKGEVILSGFVDNEAAKKKAEEVVSKINGVKSVKNSLEVKV
jgi:hyperosmotically inducible periplasmic protein